MFAGYLRTMGDRTYSLEIYSILTITNLLQLLYEQVDIRMHGPLHYFQRFGTPCPCKLFGQLSMLRWISFERDTIIWQRNSRVDFVKVLLVLGVCRVDIYNPKIFRYARYIHYSHVGTYQILPVE